MSKSFSKQILCGISKTNNGELRGKAKISNFDMLRMNIELKETICSVADSIMLGKMSPHPSFEGQAPRCDNCSMKAVCRSAWKFEN